MNPHRPTEAYLKMGEAASVHLQADILISGRENRNRAVHGDLVAVELLPETLWSAPSSALTSAAASGEDEKAGLSLFSLSLSDRKSVV